MDYDVIIIGGGPSGIRTALELKKRGVEKLIILEMEKSLGGALRDIIEEDPSFGSPGMTGVELSQDLINLVETNNIEYMTTTQVLKVEKDLKVRTITMSEGIKEFKGKAIVLATGARERPRGTLNFTSKRSTGIFSVGTARKFVVEEGYLPGRNIVIYGSDITGLYLSRILKVEGARTVTIVDPSKEIKFPSEDLKEILTILGVEFMSSYVIKEIEGSERITGVTFESQNDGRSVFIPCDALLLSVGLSPQKSLIKRFRRDQEGYGVFTTGNAEAITFDMEEIVESAQITAEKVAMFLSSNH